MQTTPTPGRYRAGVPLGEGGLALVYVGHVESGGPPVALKFLRPELVDDDLCRRRFLREAEIGLLLNHPNIVTTRALDEQNGFPLLVLDLVGPSLDAVKQALTRDYDAIRWIASEALHALAYLEQEGVVHRDISPANLLVDPRGRVRLADFGLATRHDGTATPGHAGGTRPYCCPELLRGERGTTDSDRFSLGVTLYELACGELPFGRTPDAIATGHARCAPPLPRQVPRALRQIIIRLLAIDPAQRLRIDEVKRLLGRVHPSNAARPAAVTRSWFRKRCPGLVHPLERVALPAQRPEREAKRSRSVVTVSASAAVTAAACIAGVAMLDREPRPETESVTTGAREYTAPAEPPAPAPGRERVRLPNRDESVEEPARSTTRARANPDTTAHDQTRERKTRTSPLSRPSSQRTLRGRSVEARQRLETISEETRELARAAFRKRLRWTPHPVSGGVHHTPARWDGDALVLVVKAEPPFELRAALLDEIVGELQHGRSSLGPEFIEILIPAVKGSLHQGDMVGLVLLGARGSRSRMILEIEIP